MAENSKSTKIEGEPMKIVKIENNKCVYSLEPLMQRLENPENANEKVCVLVITGKLRAGKSFLLNCFICYLEWLEAGSPPGVDWINLPCDGFNAGSGFEHVTLGIDVWPKLYTIKASHGSNLKLLLVDTRGQFDSQSKMKDCAAIFGIASLLSSVMIYNNKNLIGSDDLGNLTSFVDFANKVAERSGNKPLQKLIFLVRDCTLCKKFGFDAGAEYLASLRKDADNEVAENWSLLDRAAMKVVGCCHPTPHGPGVEEGHVANMGDEFRRELPSFIVKTVGDLDPKEMNGHEMTCGRLAAQLQIFPKTFKYGELPDCDNVRQANLKMSLDIICRDVLKQFYEVIVAAAVGREDFQSCYQTEKKEALAQFEKKSASFGESRQREKVAKKLREEMDGVFKRFEEKNNNIIGQNQLAAKLEELMNQMQDREQAHQLQIDQLHTDMQNAKTEAHHERLKAEKERKQREHDKQRQLEEQRKKEIIEKQKAMEENQKKLEEENAEMRRKLEEQNQQGFFKSVLSKVGGWLDELP